ncbi:hypothetical protein RND81_09G035800 [Saponaria officinalis]|uniref:Maturase K n=1 Tax=Saponaria officinalis TaxID=3572 RepID=A0AAW1IHH2_SAPOF
MTPKVLKKFGREHVFNILRSLQTNQIILRYFFNFTPHSPCLLRSLINSLNWLTNDVIHHYSSVVLPPIFTLLRRHFDFNLLSLLRPSLFSIQPDHSPQNRSEFMNSGGGLRIIFHFGSFCPSYKNYEGGYIEFDCCS